MSGLVSPLGDLPGKGVVDGSCVGVCVSVGAGVALSVGVSLGAGVVEAGPDGEAVGVAVGVAVRVGDGVGDGGLTDGVGAGVGVGVGVGVWVAVGAAEPEVEAVGTGPMAGAVGIGSAEDDDGDGSAGLETTGSLGAGFSGPSVDGPSGPHEGPMFGTGGGVSMTGSTAMGLVGTLLGDPSSGVGREAGSEASPVAGASTEGEASGVVLDSGAVKPDSTLAEGVVLPPGPAFVAGRIWLEAATPRASAPASTMEAGTASFFTITPRMLVAPRYGRGSTCPGTIVPRGRPDNAWGLGRMGYF